MSETVETTADEVSEAGEWLRSVVDSGTRPQTYAEHLEASRIEADEAAAAHTAHMDPSNERTPEHEAEAVRLHELAEGLARYVERVEADDPDKAKGRRGINQGPQGSPPPVDAPTGDEWLRGGANAAAGRKASRRGQFPFG